MKKIILLMLLFSLSFSSYYYDHCLELKENILQGLLQNCQWYKQALIDPEPEGNSCNWDFFNKYCAEYNARSMKECWINVERVYDAIEKIKKVERESTYYLTYNSMISSLCFSIRQSNQYGFCDEELNSHINCLCDTSIYLFEDINCPKPPGFEDTITPPPIVVPDDEHCYNEIKDKDEEGIDCGGKDCISCEWDIAILPKNGIIVADGETPYPITIIVTYGDLPKQGETIYFSVKKEEGDLENIGSISKASATTDSKGMISIEYHPPKILSSDNQEEVRISITAKHNKESTTEYYTLLPIGVSANIEKVVPVQVLKDAPMIAGKETAVMVAIKSTGGEIYKKSDSSKFYLTFNAVATDIGNQDAGKFTPFSEFRFVLDEGPNLDAVQTISENNVNEYLDFMGVQKESGAIYHVYIFYIDHPSTALKGYYYFSAALSVEKITSGKIEEKDLGGADAKAKVYPSPNLKLTILPVAVGAWDPNLCELCVDTSKFSLYNFACTKQGIARLGKTSSNLFDFMWEGKLSQNFIDQLYSESSFWKKIFEGPSLKFCKKEFQKEFTKSELEAYTSKSPYLYSLYPNTPPATPEQRYVMLVTESIDYLKGVMPIAEEKLTYKIYNEPKKIPTINSHTTSLSDILFALELFHTKFIDSSYERVIGVVPVDGQRNIVNIPYSDINFDDEGYMSGLYSDEAVIISHLYAGPNTMTHEIAHTYCAVDEYTPPVIRFLTSAIVIPGFCGEGIMRINTNRGTDQRGTPVTNGFWVAKRKLMGIPSNPKYSFMGSAEDDQQWISDELYFGLGSNLHVFPFFQSNWKEEWD
ncbi:MAG: hypothetical protein WC501_00425 [Candidatus Micrarchaeia archaeon]